MKHWVCSMRMHFWNTNRRRLKSYLRSGFGKRLQQSPRSDFENEPIGQGFTA